MRKRFQVFVSSTFEDLRPERQAAVEAILKAGHIPAGMELFTAGDQSQMDVIRHWIDGSDIFMLILGGRYGSIEPKSGKSYIELEYDIALASGIPLFAVVQSNEGRNKKVTAHGTSVIEMQHEEKYRAFRKRVLTSLCAFYTDVVDVKLAIHETLPQITSKGDLIGWVSAADIQTPVVIANELARVSSENANLRKKLQRFESTVDPVAYDEIKSRLSRIEVEVPAKFVSEKKAATISLFIAFQYFGSELAGGVTNTFGASEYESFIFNYVAKRLATFGLVEHGKSPSSAAWTRLKLSKEGVKFLARAQVEPPQS